MPGEPRQRLWADLALLGTSLIWGSAFVAQRIAALQVGVFLFNGARFLLAGLVLLPILRLTRGGRGRLARIPLVSLGGAAAAGLLLFGGAALQQAGLTRTTAGNAGFITGLYVVFIPILMAIGWRKRHSPVIWAAAVLAAAGLFLLSTGGEMGFNPGDLLVLAGAVFWALHVILIGRLVQRVDVLPLAIGQYAVCGLLSLIAGAALEPNQFTALIEGWWAIIYTGVFSVGIGYTLQVVGQRLAPPADAAILLSMEAVFAAFLGWWILGERLSSLQLAGCGIMLVGMLFAQTPAWQRKPRPSANVETNT